MIKFIGFIFIILSCSGIGMVLGSSFYIRVMELRNIKSSLQMLETEIVYSNTPLGDAFENVSKMSKGVSKVLFNMMSNNLNKRIYSTVGEAFEKAIDDIREKVYLNKEDMEILKSFGYSLGNSDIEGQIKNFKMAIKQLEQQEFKAEQSRNKNEKMYKNLGFLSGIAIAILLL